MVKALLQKKIEALVADYSDPVKNGNQLAECEQWVRSIFSGENLLIYGAGGAGTHLRSILGNLQIAFSGFVDRNAVELQKIQDDPVYSPEWLLQQQGYLVIIAGNRSIEQEIFAGLSAEIMEHHCVVRGYELMELLSALDCWMNIRAGKGLRYSQCMNCEGSTHNCRVQQYFSETCGIRVNDERKPLISLLGIITGQYCSLKCKLCCEAVPFIEQPVFSKKEDIISGVKKIAAASRFIQRIEFVGGEPFLHKELPELLKELLKISNVGFISIFTNGTVMPSEELLECLRQNRVAVTYSDYSKQLRSGMRENGKKVLECLKENGVDLLYHDPYSRTWMDFQHWNERKISESELKNMYGDCFISQCIRLFQGVLYHCPHYFSGIQLGEVKHFEDSEIRLDDYDIDSLENRLDAWLHCDYLSACKYCNMPYHAPTYPAAEQIDDR